MRLDIRREEFQPSEDQRWLGSAHATDTAESITLDATLFDAGDFPDGFIPSGVVVGQVTATGKYGPYDAAATDGRENAAGFLFTTKAAEIGAGGDTEVGAALLWHGQVRTAYLPAASGLDQAAADALPHVHFVGEIPA